MLATITPITPAIKLIGLAAATIQILTTMEIIGMTGPNGSRKAGTFSMSFFLNQITANAVGMYWKKRKTTDSSANCSNDPLSRKAMVSKPEKIIATIGAFLLFFLGISHIQASN